MMNSPVDALAVDGAGNLYAGGEFNSAGGVSANFIAKWDGAAWSPLGSGMNWPVYALAVDGAGNLYAGGAFTTAGGVEVYCIAKWDGTAWLPLGSGMENAVQALAVDGAGNLYAGGAFTTAGGVSANYIAKWDGTAWSPLGSGMNNAVYALAVDGAVTCTPAAPSPRPAARYLLNLAQWTGGSPLLGIHRQGGGVVLTWTYAAANTSYEIWRYTSPYFDLVSPPATLIASGLPLAGCTLTGGVITCSLSGGIGDSDTNYFYVVRGIQAGGPTANSNRTGGFDFMLTPGG